MTLTYATPLAFKAALEARIAERARAWGRPMNRVRQILVMELRATVRQDDLLERLREAARLTGGVQDAAWIDP